MTGSPDGGSGVPAEINWGQQPQGYSAFRWLFKARAITTPEAQANKVSGTVILRATFHADGTISDIEVLNPVEFMTDSAIESLKRCRFKPATINGKPITVRRVPIRIEVTATVN
jgi:TonB family protein